MVALEIRGRAQGEVLHRIVRRGLPRFRRAVEAADKNLPGFVWRELERFERCGDPAYGFAWLVCDPCAHHRLVPFSCGGRGFCPTCGGRRMAALAAHWVDRVLPEVGLRQWVVTVPWERRWLLARRPDLARKLIGLALRRIRRFLRKRAEARGVVGGRSGSLTVVQRFGSALNLNVHFHVLALDGVYARGPDGRLVFHRDRPPTTEDVERLVEQIAEAAQRMFAREGFGREEPDEEAEPDDALALIQAASIAGQSAIRGRRARRHQVLGGRAYRLPPRCAACDGYTVHAGTAVGSRDAEGRERLCRYLARPALARPRLKELPDGGALLELKTPWSDGTASLTFTPEELVERLAALVPQPRSHVVLYHGVLAGRSSWRSEVVPDPPQTVSQEDASPLTSSRVAASSHYKTWAALLFRVFGVAGWRCPQCGGAMRLRAHSGGQSTERILEGLERSARGPPGGLVFVA